ncbi:MAG: DUF4855 domain-containing protein [Bacteroidales bacterium]|nr:DUF4855 domain-containing protein [Bacteroidales bacterium]
MTALSRLFIATIILTAPVAVFGQAPTDEVSCVKGRWTARRGETFANLALCYGGDMKRDPAVWTKERFATHVSWTDPASGREEWLFDGFLPLDYQFWGPDGTHYTMANDFDDGMVQSAGKEQWQGFIDYWFASQESGLHALDDAIEDAAGRIGRPPYKRKILMNMPDAILHQFYADTLGNSSYWGDYKGQRLDFHDNVQRFLAEKWYIDKVSHTFKEAHFKHLELVGFYIHHEEIPTPWNGWCWAWKKTDILYPLISKYLHENGYCLGWIPYREAAGYDMVEELGIDYCWMQPNYFWRGNDYPWDETIGMIYSGGDRIEFEFDDNLLTETPDHDIYRKRYLQYIYYTVSSGLYEKSVAYYLGHDTVYKFAVSSDPQEKRLWTNFCRFLTRHPLREKIRR